MSVAEQHHYGCRQHRERNQDEDPGDQHVPGEDGHPEHGHAGGAEVEDRGDQVDGREDCREPGQRQGEDPYVRTSAGGVDGVGQGRVGHPSEVRRPACREEPQQHRDGAAEIEPVGEGVEPGEGHVRRADLERNDVVGEPTKGEGPGEQVQHQAAMHREHLVVHVEAEQRVVRGDELGADHHGHHPGQVEHDDRGHHVAHADDLVVGRGDPLEEAGRLALRVVTSYGAPVGTLDPGSGARKGDDVGHVTDLPVSRSVAAVLASHPRYWLGVTALTWKIMSEW